MLGYRYATILSSNPIKKGTLARLEEILYGFPMPSTSHRARFIHIINDVTYFPSDTSDDSELASQGEVPVDKLPGIPSGFSFVPPIDDTSDSDKITVVFKFTPVVIGDYLLAITWKLPNGVNLNFVEVRLHVVN